MLSVLICLTRLGHLDFQPLISYADCSLTNAIDSLTGTNRLSSTAPELGPARFALVTHDRRDLSRSLDLWSSSRAISE